MKHTKGKRNRVRSHHALIATQFSSCSHCARPSLPHTVCQNCGYYKGRQVVDVLANLDKKERRKKEKELHAHEEEAAAKSASINAEELSHK